MGMLDDPLLHLDAEPERIDTEGDDGEVFVEEDETMDLAKRDDIYNGIGIREWRNRLRL